MSALEKQEGGSHYKDCAIQPIQYIEANKIAFLEGCVIKRCTRHDKPTGKGRQDIEKAIHELQLLLELRYSAPPNIELKLSASTIQYTPHDGGMCPFDPIGIIWVAVKFRSGNCALMTSDKIRWEWSGGAGDVVGYSIEQKNG